MTTISKHCGVSWSTVSRTLASLLPMTNVKRNWLPRCLLVDEFRSLKNQVGPYSFFLYGWRYWEITGYSSFT
nr:hypothetical protein [Enterococcus avium]